jgi:hypothetical protein
MGTLILGVFDIITRDDYIKPISLVTVITEIITAVVK